MEHHGAESYYVLGEGLLTESGGGRKATLSPELEAKTAPFRFSRMGPPGTGVQLGDATRRLLATAMTTGTSAASRIPSGFTYLGQFIDHDLTFDKTAVTFGEDISPAQLLEGRSPVLDLDSLYGNGPADPTSAQFYSDGLRIKMGGTLASGDPAIPNFDLPRHPKGNVTVRRTALIPEPRNDENLVVAQTHLAFIRFHNRVCDTLPTTPPAQQFSRARRKVTKHYQWMIRTDFLPRICDKAVVNDVFKNGRKVFEVGAVPTSMPTMPIEFSIAAYRLGHSMVRAAYNWNKNFDDGSGTLDLLFQFTGKSGNLGGEDHLLSIWIADFRRLYNFAEAGRADLVVPAAKFNRAERIDTRLVTPLHDLPQGSIGPPPVPDGDERRNLAYRNLTRANMVSLATGQQMAAFMRSKGVSVTTLTNAQISNGKGGVTLDGLSKKQRARVVSDTPLWFYVLREAELNAGRLTGVGARIVAETFHRAMEGSTFSIVRDPTWRPQLGPDTSTFRMVDLLLFACNGKANLINPLGD
jgi:Animal haem peroxidase